MKKKIIGMIICMLLITSYLGLIQNTEAKNCKVVPIKLSVDDKPELIIEVEIEIFGIPLPGFLCCMVHFYMRNIGDSTADFLPNTDLFDLTIYLHNGEVWYRGDHAGYDHFIVEPGERKECYNFGLSLFHEIFEGYTYFELMIDPENKIEERDDDYDNNYWEGTVQEHLRDYNYKSRPVTKSIFQNNPVKSRYSILESVFMRFLTLGRSC